MNHNEAGFVYVATGKKYIDEVTYSSQYLKKSNPNYPICLFTDQVEHFNSVNHCFDLIIKVENPYYSLRDKLIIGNSPFEKTIFLDTDTLCLDTIDELFELLDNFEMIVHSNAEGYHYHIDNKYPTPVFPEFNTGVLGFRKSLVNTKEFFKKWEQLYLEYDYMKLTDQVSFRILMATGILKYCWIPSAYNFFIYFPAYTALKVKIIHGRSFEKLHAIAKKINDTDKLTSAWTRTYYSDLDEVIYEKMNLKDSYSVLFKLFVIAFKNTFRFVKKIVIRK